MANRATPLTNIETLSGNISAATFFDNNIGPAMTALNDASLGYVNYIGTDTGSANNYIVAPGFGVASALNVGMDITFKPANSNTAASTLTVTPLTSAAIVRPDGTACIGGEIVVGVMITVIFDGTSFRIVALPWLPFKTNLGTITTSQTINCANASSVIVAFNTNAASISITFNNIVAGVPVFLNMANVSGALSTVLVAATKPGGGSLTPSLIQQGVVGIQTGFQWATGKSLYSSGANDGIAIYLTGIQSA